jgi:hypothetical protein
MSLCYKWLHKIVGTAMTTRVDRLAAAGVKFSLTELRDLAERIAAALIKDAEQQP